MCQSRALLCTRTVVYFNSLPRRQKLPFVPYALSSRIESLSPPLLSLFLLLPHSLFFRFLLSLPLCFPLFLFPSLPLFLFPTLPLSLFPTVPLSLFPTVESPYLCFLLSLSMVSADRPQHRRHILVQLRDGRINMGQAGWGCSCNHRHGIDIPVSTAG